MSAIFQISNVQFFYEMAHTAFSGIGWFLLAYVICIVGFFVIGKETLSLAFLYPFVFMLLTIFNPFLIVPIAEKIGLITRIRRMFWLLPINLVLAYVFTSLCFLRTKKLIRILTAAFCVLFIVLCGSFVKPYLRMPDNIYKVSHTVVELSDLIEADAKETGIDTAALYSSQQLLELRQYDPAIRSLLRRDDLLDWEIDSSDDAAVQKVIRSRHHLHILALVSRYGVRIDTEVFLKSARKCNANYIITHTDMNLGDYFVSAGYEKIGQVEDFEVYHIKWGVKEGTHG